MLIVSCRQSIFAEAASVRRRPASGVALLRPESGNLVGRDASLFDAVSEHLFGVGLAAIDEIDIRFDQRADFFFHGEQFGLIRP